MLLLLLLFQLTSKTATQLKAKHVTPVKKYMDDLTFDLTASGGDSGCDVSVSTFNFKLEIVLKNLLGNIV